MSSEDVTTRMHVDISELRRSMQDAQRQIRLANAEFKEAAAAMDDWKSSSEGLEAKLTQLRSTLSAQESILSSLEQQYAQVAEEQGESSKGAQELAIKIANQKAAISTTERSISQYENALVDLNTESDDVADNSRTAASSIENVGDSADKAEKQTGGLAKGLANLAKKGMAAVVTAAAGVVTAFLGSAEATREYREDMNKLKTAYKSAGLSAETATNMYKSFFSVLGEEDRSVEAVNHLAKLTKKQDELAKWTDICAGVWGTFGDSLPIEGLTEAANETAKVGQVTGPLADALNWAGISEDEFNEKLKKCNSEQERSTLITNTLNDTYAEAAKNYKELNGNIMDAQRAQSELTDTTAELGAAAEPVMTTFKLFAASILKDLLPGTKQLSQGFSDMLNGVDGAGESVGNAVSNLIMSLLNKIIELFPKVVEVGLSLISNLIMGLLSAVPKLVTTAVQLMTMLIKSISDMFPQIVSEVIKIIPNIIAAFMKQLPVFIQACVTFFMGIIDALPQVIQAILQALPQLITSIIEGLMSGINALTEGAVTLLMGIVDAIPQITDTLIEALPTIIEAIITGLVTALPQLLEAGITLFMALIDALPTIIVALTEALPDIIDAITDTLLDNMPILLDCAVTLFMALVQAIPKIVVALAKAVPQIITAIMEALYKLLPKLLSFGVSIRKKVLDFFIDITKKSEKKAGEFVSKILNKINYLPEDVKSIGGDMVSGLWNGIDNKVDWLTGKIKDFADGVTDKLKGFFGIHSPSRVMRDQVGKFITLGVGEGISKYISHIEKDVKKLGNGLMKYLKKNMSEKEFKSYGEKIVDKLSEGINNKVKSFETSISNLTKKAQDAISEIEKSKESMESMLNGVGGLYETDSNGNMILSDLNAQTKEIKQYASNLKKLKGKISQDLMNEILAMSETEGFEYTKQLLSMSTKELSAYNKSYSKKLKASEKIANQWYAKKIKSVKKNYSDKVGNVFEKLVKKINGLGADAVNGFLKGLNNKSKISKELSSFSKSVVKQIKKEFGIHSPSRVMRDEVGKYLSLGIADGITQNKDAIKDAMRDLANDISNPIDFDISKAKAGVVSGSRVNNVNGSTNSTSNSYTFNQYNNSPKALSRLEIYRQTRNQLNFAKGV